MNINNIMFCISLTALILFGDSRNIEIKLIALFVFYISSRRMRYEEIKKSKSNRKNNTRQTKNVRIRLVNQRADKRKNSAGK